MTRRLRRWQHTPTQLVLDGLAMVGLATVAVTAAGTAIVVGRVVEAQLQERNRRRALVLVVPTRGLR